ncbi:MAG: glycerophosphodiester phosphodiesterase [Thermocrispum sp.]
MTRTIPRGAWALLSSLAAVALLVAAGVVFWPDGAELPDTPGPAPPAQSDVLVIAHRGASAYAPHDTVAAAREAVARGADAIEADVRQTGDGHLVALFHPTLEATTNAEQVFPGRGPWRVESFTLAEVRRLDSGSWFGPAFAGARVPTLTELADALEGSDVELIIEVKTPQRYPGIGQRVLREILTRPNRYREVESFDLTFLRRFARLSPPVELGAAKGVPPGRMAEVASYIDAVNTPVADVDPAYVERAREVGLEVKVWSLNTPTAVRRAEALGVDGIYSHRPDMVLEVLGR